MREDQPAKKEASIFFYLIALLVLVAMNLYVLHLKDLREERRRLVEQKRKCLETIPFSIRHKVNHRCDQP